MQKLLKNKVFFVNLNNFVIDLKWKMLETYLSKNWYFLDCDLTGRDMGLKTRFLISMTELLVTMNSFTITERNKNEWIYQWICDFQMI